MKTQRTQSGRMFVAARLAPEDIACGDFVAVLNEIVEYPSFLWCGDWGTSAAEPVRVQWCASDAGTPFRVTAVCLPFVFLKSPGREFRTVDTRQVQLVRLSRPYARLVWKHLRKQAARRKNVLHL